MYRFLCLDKKNSYYCINIAEISVGIWYQRQYKIGEFSRILRIALSPPFIKIESIAMMVGMNLLNVVIKQKYFQSTVDDRLDALGVYFKRKAFGSVVLVRTWTLDLKCKKWKARRSARQVSFLQKLQNFSENWSQNHSFQLFPITTTIIPQVIYTRIFHVR